ncbi:class D beta-lactamase [Sporohalobacter salinus]|uniref:class D beta-lactamase n=1 Tax=Sporohalobacter salinus TaxID=1494606 RepID=UPI001961E259|nr:class D beta-lactamase [Sporohalobacter salinus]MBM7623933.1 beta-lactamase class D [Sporohalobacter salinus]
MSKKRILFITLILLVILSLPIYAATNEYQKNDINLRNYFENKENISFVLYNLEDDSYSIYNESQVNEPLSPASTFKICHSLIALQTGVLKKDKLNKMKWNGKKYPIKSWNKDQTLSSAVSHSVVWYFQKVAVKIGKDRMKSYLSKLHYGNEQISRINTFWFDNSLKISAKEQVEFMKKLYTNKLPFDRKVMDKVKKIITLEETKNYIFSGKTGTLSIDRKNRLGWFVGYFHNKNTKQRYVFALTIKNGKQAKGWKAKKMSKSLLVKLNSIN